MSKLSENHFFKYSFQKCFSENAIMANKNVIDVKQMSYEEGLKEIFIRCEIISFCQNIFLKVINCFGQLNPIFILKFSNIIFQTEIKKDYHVYLSHNLDSLIFSLLQLLKENVQFRMNN